LTALLLISLPSCARKTVEHQKLPDFNGQEAQVYYQLWIETEKELEECVRIP
jgi:hypothetical protein